MNKYKYKASDWEPFIEKVEIEKETNCFVQCKGVPYRDAKESNGVSFVDTFDEAKDWLVRKREESIESCERSIKYNQAQVEFLRKRIEEIKAMEETK